MQPDALTVGQRAALRRLQRAQLAEGRRIRQAVAVGAIR
jgi:protein-disulfide isomerase-like protein with CxxC motif